MKTNIIFIAIVAVSLLACKKDNTEPDTNNSLVPLTEQEKSDLRFLREEEKLARDVYIYSYAKYGTNVFDNISGSEQNHMNSVLTLLTKYGLSDPILDNTPGVFQDSVLQGLYVALTLKSDSSLVKALEVGATIEDLDIDDIQHFKANTSKTDLLNVYDKLECGSRNHIRAYSSQLQTHSVTYIPQYISQVEYDQIINAAHEQCGE